MLYILFPQISYHHPPICFAIMKRKQFLSKQILFKIKFQSPRGESRNLNVGYSILRLERTSVFVQKTEILRGRSTWRC